MATSADLASMVDMGCHENFQNERAFRERVIGGLLGALWNLGDEVFCEYNILVATTSVRVDYVV